MSDKPAKISAFAVTLVFEDAQPIVTATYLAPDALMAVALVAVDAARQTGDKKLVGYGVREIDGEWLRHALKVVEGGEPRAPVFSLVSNLAKQPGAPDWVLAKAQEEANQKQLAAQTNRCWRHPEQAVAEGGFCPICHGSTDDAA